MSSPTKVSMVTADGVEVFYRSAGSSTAPVVLLLHGFPSSSHMFRNLIPLLASKYYVIAPGLWFHRRPRISQLQIHLRFHSPNHCSFPRRPKHQKIRCLHFRLRRTHRLPPRSRASRRHHRSRHAKRKCLCRRSRKRLLGSNPTILDLRSPFRPRSNPHRSTKL